MMLDRFLPAIKHSSSAAGAVHLDRPRVIEIGQLDHERKVVLAPSGKEINNLTPVGSSSYVRILARLRYLGQYADGWDGRGTKAALKDSFRLATAFLGLLPELGVQFRLDAMIYAPGTAVLSLVSDEVDARLEFLPDGTIAANIDSAQAEIDADIFGFDGLSLPPGLSKLLATDRNS
jgi:hypothetical protein